MRRALLFLAGAGILAAFSQASLHAEDLVLARFKDYVDSLRIQARIPAVSAAIVGRTDVMWEQAFGYQDLDKSIAARVDTPYPVDGLTQVLAATLVLRCVEEGHLSLDDRIERFRPGSADAALTLRQVLAHGIGSPDAMVFNYKLERLEPIAAAIRVCTGDSFRETVANLLDRFAMVDSVPGPDILGLTPPAEGIPTPEAAARYAQVLSRTATPYPGDQQARNAAAAQQTAPTLTPWSGLISTVRDLARFDLALKADVLLRPETLVLSWRTPSGREGQRYPHGLGWFVQHYNGEPVAWQFGMSESGSSSLIISVPSRWITLILLANGPGLVKPFSLSAGDLMTSPFGRLFLSSFVR